MDQEKTNLDSYVHRIIVLRRKKRMILIMLIIFVIIVVFGLQFYLVDQKGRVDMGFDEKVDTVIHFQTFCFHYWVVFIRRMEHLCKV